VKPARGGDDELMANRIGLTADSLNSAPEADASKQLRGDRITSAANGGVMVSRPARSLRCGLGLGESPVAGDERRGQALGESDPGNPAATLVSAAKTTLT
jgi:hypothetical protein